MPDTVDPFAFYTERRLVVLTGRKASNLEELHCHLTQVSGSCIFYHTHYLYLIHHFEKPRFYNEFANWVSQELQEERLAERLAAIDLPAMTSIRELQEAVAATILKHLEGNPKAQRECPPGGEFHFCEAKSFYHADRPGSTQRAGVLRSDRAGDQRLPALPFLRGAPAVGTPH